MQDQPLMNQVTRLNVSSAWTESWKTRVLDDVDSFHSHEVHLREVGVVSTRKSAQSAAGSVRPRDAFGSRSFD